MQVRRIFAAIFAAAAVAAPIAGSEQADGDVWLTANAHATKGQWRADDPAHASFALWLNGRGFMPYEGRTAAAGIWVRRPGCLALFDNIGRNCGWDLGLAVTQWKSIVVGGATIEIDGNGAPPFGRVTNASDGAERYIGVASNAFGDFSGVDDRTAPSWIAAIDVTTDGYRIRRADATHAGARVPFRTLVDVNRYGDVRAAGEIGGTHVVQTSSGQWATRARLRGGKYRFAFPRKFRHAPVCVATSEGENGFVLHVATEISGCRVTSSGRKDESVIDVIAVGNPD